MFDSACPLGAENAWEYEEVRGGTRGDRGRSKTQDSIANVRQTCENDHSVTKLSTNMTSSENVRKYMNMFITPSKHAKT